MTFMDLSEVKMNGHLLNGKNVNVNYCLHCHNIINSSVCNKVSKQCPNNTVRIEEAEGRLKSQVQLAMTQVEFQHSNLMQLKVQLDDFDRCYLQCKNDIKFKANELVSKIREHEERLLQELEIHLDIEYKKCGFRSGDICKMEQNINALTELCDILLRYEQNEFLEKFKIHREEFNLLKLDMSGMKCSVIKPRTIDFTPIKCNTSFGTLNINEPVIERPFSLNRRGSLKINPNIVLPLPKNVNNNEDIPASQNLNKFQMNKKPLTRKLSLQVSTHSHNAFPPIIESPIFPDRTSLPSTTSEELDLSFSSDIDEECFEMLWCIKTEGPQKGQINCPSDVAFLSDKTLVVSDRGNNRLQLFDIHGNATKIIADRKIKPFRVDCTSNDNIIITDSKESYIKMYDRKGHHMSNLGRKFFKSSNPFKEPCAVSHIVGQFIVSDLETNAVYMCNNDGKITKQLDPEFKKPFYIATSMDRILVSDNLDHCVKVFDSSGNYLFQCVLPNTNSQGYDQSTNYLQYPTGVCTDEHGNIYVADWGSHTVSLFNNEGEFERHLLTKEDGLYQPAGIAVIEDYLAVSNYSESNSSILMFKINF